MTSLTAVRLMTAEPHLSETATLRQARDTKEFVARLLEQTSRTPLVTVHPNAEDAVGALRTYLRRGLNMYGVPVGALRVTYATTTLDETDDFRLPATFFNRGGTLFI
ncbi:hypothetical protein [Deinococcus soli (ex Cha et al. 2016)]|uniref:Uncharacterized protein n=2 Tax=Deinococcus soli (ex Cha et al. 2016) TaxID=1309411 RepID=A0AAE4BNH7_9DEIO|nr:hypothetical protein [Deinococcus soli (ex Cha et al. 2016)]MDR6218721.1 hypothetical protein [Deinococcus soli (ex Cha et al. 2016)]MDR6328518.1 hypothetical protein [Deinococcus soli (ex Cha et al. 2016)]MDR6753129.1 hypothetical protein [Deinococcus soli (ex Cha et al. 2016)]